MRCIHCDREMEYDGEGTYTCDKCGFSVNDLVYRPNYAGGFIKWQEVEPKVYEQGWVCPKCGSVMSPKQPYCLFCCSCQNTPVSITSVWTSDSTNIQT